jgi:uncharacterized protein YqgC (DUF456 family)
VNEKRSFYGSAKVASIQIFNPLSRDCPVTAICWTLIITLMLAGLAGCIFPLLPDTPLIVAAAVLHHCAFGERGASWTTLLVLTLLMLVSLALDIVSGSIGAKYFGATRWGAIGGILGALVGIFWGPIGLFVGPLVGVLMGEMLGGQGILPAGRSTWGTFLGTVAGMVGKFAIAILMIGWFLVVTMMGK